MSSANLNSYMKEHLKRQPRTLSMSQIEELIEYDAWLESRSPTLRAPDKDDTTKSPLQTCSWTRIDDEESSSYDTACGSAYYFIDGDLDENEVVFCFHCGKPISS